MVVTPTDAAVHDLRLTFERSLDAKRPVSRDENDHYRREKSKQSLCSNGKESGSSSSQGTNNIKKKHSGQSINSDTNNNNNVTISTFDSVANTAERITDLFTSKSSCSNRPQNSNSVDFPKTLAVLSDIQNIVRTAASCAYDKKWDAWCQSTLFGLVSACLCLTDNNTTNKPWKDALAIWKQQTEHALEFHIQRYRSVLSHLVSLATRYHCWGSLELLLNQDTPIYGFGSSKGVVEATFAGFFKNLVNFDSGNVGGNVGGVLGGSGGGQPPSQKIEEEVCIISSDNPQGNFYACMRCFVVDKTAHKFLDSFTVFPLNALDIRFKLIHKSMHYLSDRFF
eukprot:gene1039-991_t